MDSYSIEGKRILLEVEKCFKEKKNVEMRKEIVKIYGLFQNFFENFEDEVRVKLLCYTTYILSLEKDAERLRVIYRFLSHQNIEVKTIEYFYDMVFRYINILIEKKKYFFSLEIIQKYKKFFQSRQLQEKEEKLKNTLQEKEKRIEEDIRKGENEISEKKNEESKRILKIKKVTLCTSKYIYDKDEYKFEENKPFNNFWLLPEKEVWLSREENEEIFYYNPKDENIAKRSIGKFPYEECWEMYSDIFGKSHTVICSNSHYYIRTIVLSEYLKNNPHLLRERLVCVDLKDKKALENLDKKVTELYKKLVGNTPVNSKNLSRIIINEKDKVKRNLLVFNIIFSYLNNIKSVIFTDEENTDIEGTSLVFYSFDSKESLVIKKKNECSRLECSNQRLDFPCEICGEKLYCSDECRFADLTHIKLHFKLSKYYKNEVLEKMQIFLRNRLANYYPSLTARIVGLKNLGSTCFMNSALQCVFACNLLSAYFLNFEEICELDQPNDPDIKNDRLITEFKKLIQSVTTEPTGNYVVRATPPESPKYLRLEFVELEPKYRKLIQHDSQEFLTDFLNQLGSKLNRSLTRRYYVSEDSKEQSSQQRYWYNFLNKENSIITDLFYFLSETNYTCTCKNCDFKKKTFDTSLILLLPINDISIKIKKFPGFDEYEEISPFKYSERENLDLIKIPLKKEGMVQIVKNGEDIDELDEFAYVFYKSKKKKFTVFVFPDKNKLFKQYPIMFESDDKREFNKLMSLHFYSKILQPNGSLKLSSCFENKGKFEYHERYFYIWLMKTTHKTPEENEVIKNEIVSKVPESQDITFDINQCLFGYKYNAGLKTECQKCKKGRKAAITEISRLPYYLFISFKRFMLLPDTRKFQKMKNPINYEEEIDLKKYLSPESNLENTKYKLIAVTIHNGKLNGGHYVTKRKKDNEWFLLNDNLIHNCSKNQHNSKDAVFLLYQQK